jgi:magnesium-transporting ATPase (P-type)
MAKVVSEYLEQDLELSGVTGVEDRLQRLLVFGREFLVLLHGNSFAPNDESSQTFASHVRRSKRMGIIVQFQQNENVLESGKDDSEIWFYQKGADTVMFCWNWTIIPIRLESEANGKMSRIRARTTTCLESVDTNYQASSPDEIAIIRYTEEVGLKLAYRDRQSIV